MLSDLLFSVTVVPEGKAASPRKDVKEGAALVDAVAFARDLGNLPGNHATPVYLARRAREMTGGKLTVKVHNRGEIKKLLVMEDLPKPANFHGGGSQPIGHGVTSTLKRILGTVPVDGRDGHRAARRGHDDGGQVGV